MYIAESLLKKNGKPLNIDGNNKIAAQNKMSNSEPILLKSKFRVTTILQFLLKNKIIHWCYLDLLFVVKNNGNGSNQK